MIALPFALLMLLQVAVPQAGQSARTSEKASIEGIVLRSESTEPLARAEVKLSRIAPEESPGKFFFGGGPESDTQGLPSASTETDGKFLLKDLGGAGGPPAR